MNNAISRLFIILIFEIFLSDEFLVFQKLSKPQGRFQAGLRLLPAANPAIVQRTQAKP